MSGKITNRFTAVSIPISVPVNRTNGFTLYRLAPLESCGPEGGDVTYDDSVAGAQARGLVEGLRRIESETAGGALAGRTRGH